MKHKYYWLKKSYNKGSNWWQFASSELGYLPSRSCCQGMWISCCDDFWLFRRVRKIAKSDYWLCHICPSALRVEQLGSYWTDFHEILYLRIFLKSVQKIQVSLKSDKNKVHITYRPIYIFYHTISCSFLLRMRNASDKCCRENQNTHFVFSKLYFENLCLYETMWKNIVERGRPQMTIWSMRIACWIPKATNTHSDCVILIAFPQQQ